MGRRFGLADFHQHAGEVFNQLYDFAAALYPFDGFCTHAYGQAKTTSQDNADQNVEQELCRHLRQHFGTSLRRQHFHPGHDGRDVYPHQRLIARDQ